LPAFHASVEGIAGAKSKLSPDRTGKNHLPLAGNAGLHGKNILPREGFGHKTAVEPQHPTGRRGCNLLSWSRRALPSAYLGREQRVVPRMNRVRFSRTPKTMSIGRSGTSIRPISCRPGRRRKFVRSSRTHCLARPRHTLATARRERLQIRQRAVRRHRRPVGDVFRLITHVHPPPGAALTNPCASRLSRIASPCDRPAPAGTPAPPAGTRFRPATRIASPRRGHVPPEHLP